MAIRKRTLLFISLLAAAALISCKKDDDESLPYLNGSLSVDFEPELPAYIAMNDQTVYKMIPKGASHPEGLEVGYRWRVTPAEETSYQTSENEDGSFKYNFGEDYKDTLCTVTVTCEAFADGYSSLSASYSTVIVCSGEKGSIQRAGYDFKNGSSVTDTRDGNKYLCYKAPDNKTWMKQNLAYDGGESTSDPLGAPYLEADAMSDVFGRFYTWDEATGGDTGSDGAQIRGICPEGWHIPSDEEWTALANAAMKQADPEWGTGDKVLSADGYWEYEGAKISREFMAGEPLTDNPKDEDYDSDINYGKEARSATFNTEVTLWNYYSSVGDPTNRSGISAIPSGYAIKTNGVWNFYGSFEYAVFWTSTSDSEDGSKAICRVIHNESPAILRDAHDKKTFAASVRCIKDE